MKKTEKAKSPGEKPNNSSDKARMQNVIKKPSVPQPNESKLEKALRLGNDEIIAHAIRDLLRREEDTR